MINIKEKNTCPQCVNVDLKNLTTFTCLLSRNSGNLNLQESYGPLEACRGELLQCDNGFSEGKFCVLFVFVLFCEHVGLAKGRFSFQEVLPSV
jgi:hypothetical protein